MNYRKWNGLTDGWNRLGASLYVLGGFAIMSLCCRKAAIMKSKSTENNGLQVISLGRELPKHQFHVPNRRRMSEEAKRNHLRLLLKKLPEPNDVISIIIMGGTEYCILVLCFSFNIVKSAQNLIIDLLAILKKNLNRTILCYIL